LGSFSLAPRAHTTITLTFTPTSTATSHKVDNVVSNSVRHSTEQIGLQGKGTRPVPVSP
jgi:hypothetical protein